MSQEDSISLDALFAGLGIQSPGSSKEEPPIEDILFEEGLLDNSETSSGSITLDVFDDGSVQEYGSAEESPRMDALVEDDSPMGSFDGGLDATGDLASEEAADGELAADSYEDASFEEEYSGRPSYFEDEPVVEQGIVEEAETPDGREYEEEDVFIDEPIVEERYEGVAQHAFEEVYEEDVLESEPEPELDEEPERELESEPSSDKVHEEDVLESEAEQELETVPEQELEPEVGQDPQAASESQIALEDEAATASDEAATAVDEVEGEEEDGPVVEQGVVEDAETPYGREYAEEEDFADHPARHAQESAESGSKSGKSLIIGIVAAIVCICIVAVVIVMNIGGNKEEALQQQPTGTVQESQGSESSLAGTHRYNYQLEGPNGTMLHVTEVASFNESGKLTRTDIIVATADGDPQTILAFLESQFGDSILESAIGNGTVAVQIDGSQSGLDEGAYESWLISSTQDFQKVD